MLLFLYPFPYKYHLTAFTPLFPPLELSSPTLAVLTQPRHHTHHTRTSGTKPTTFAPHFSHSASRTFRNHLTSPSRCNPFNNYPLYICAQFSYLRPPCPPPPHPLPLPPSPFNPHNAPPPPHNHNPDSRRHRRLRRRPNPPIPTSSRPSPIPTTSPTTRRPSPRTIPPTIAAIPTRITGWAETGGENRSE